MKSAVYPLPMDAELTESIRQAAQSHGLSMGAVMRQSIKLGLPKLNEALAAKAGRVTAVDPMSAQDCQACYAQPDDDVELIQARMGAQIWEASD